MWFNLIHYMFLYSFLLLFAYLTIYAFNREDDYDRWSTYYPSLKGAEELMLMINCSCAEDENFPISLGWILCLFYTLVDLLDWMFTVCLKHTIWTHSFHLKHRFTLLDQCKFYGISIPEVNFIFLQLKYMQEDEVKSLEDTLTISENMLKQR